MADSLLWICIASILSVFEISSVPGADIMDAVEHKDDVFAKVGIIGYVSSFICLINELSPEILCSFLDHF